MGGRSERFRVARTGAASMSCHMMQSSRKSQWGEGREPPGTHGARHRPGVSPGSGLTETATGPGSTLTARGGAYSLWLQRFAVLKLQKLQLLHRRAAGVFPEDVGSLEYFDRHGYKTNRCGFGARGGKNEYLKGGGLDCPRPDVPGVDAPGSGLTRPLAGPGSARGRDSFGLPVAPVRHSL